MSAAVSPFKFKSRAARIEAYVDADREIAAYRAAEAEEGTTPERTRLIGAAIGRRAEALREMHGGDLATARKILDAATKEAARE